MEVGKAALVLDGIIGIVQPQAVEDLFAPRLNASDDRPRADADTVFGQPALQRRAGKLAEDHLLSSSARPSRRNSASTSSTSSCASLASVDEAEGSRRAAISAASRQSPASSSTPRTRPASGPSRWL